MAISRCVLAMRSDYYALANGRRGTRNIGSPSERTVRLRCLGPWALAKKRFGQARDEAGARRSDIEKGRGCRTKVASSKIGLKPDFYQSTATRPEVESTK